MSQENKVLVLLATYNGEAYLKEQLDSILNQHNVEVLICVRDDGSQDCTLKILELYSASFPDNIKVIKKKENIHKRNNGVLSNFSALSEYALNTNYEYFCFADQDDIWLPTKLITLINAIKQHESIEDIPLLAYCDLLGVDKNNQLIFESFMVQQKLIISEQQSLYESAFQNTVTGCACLFNRKLLSLATPVPKEAVIHDFWFALVAKFNGKHIFIDERLVRYRQHDNNVIGASGQQSMLSSWRKFCRYHLTVISYLKQVGALKVNKKVASQIVLSDLTNIKRKNIVSRIYLARLCAPKRSGVLIRVYYILLFSLLPLIDKDT